eukprot:14333390-Heterocapsa_arctica.AAC.1
MAAPDEARVANPETVATASDEVGAPEAATSSWPSLYVALGGREADRGSPHPVVPAVGGSDGAGPLAWPTPEMAAEERRQRGECCAAPPAGESSEDGARRAAGG